MMLSIRHLSPLIALGITLIFLNNGVTNAQDADGIPGNCPHTEGTFYQQNLIPRYEAGGLALVDWTTGQVTRSIPSSITGTQFQVGIWSPQCQYLSGAFGTPDEKGVVIWDTVVWDVVNNTQITVFEDARIIPYPLTWDPQSTQILVETRFGAYLWKLSGQQVLLTSEVDGNARSFRAGSVRWDYATNQISGILTLPPFGTAVYDMSSGALLSLTDQFGRAADPKNKPDLVANPTDEHYPCISPRENFYTIDNVRVYYQPENRRIVMTDEGTRDLIKVIADDVDTPLYWGESWLVDCGYIVLQFGRYGSSGVMVVDMETGEKKVDVKARIRDFDVDPTGNYALISTRSEISLWHIPSGKQTVLSLNPFIAVQPLTNMLRYFDVIWALDQGQVRIKTSRYYSGQPVERVYDLADGSLIAMLDENGQPLDLLEQLAAPYGCNFKIDYQVYNQQLVLKDIYTSRMIVLVEANLEMDDFRPFGKSPDCRYIAASLGDGNDLDTVVWDLATMERVGVFENALEIPHLLNWSPYGGYAVVNTRNGGYLWHLQSDTRIQLNTGSEEAHIWFYGNYYRASSEYICCRPNIYIRSFHYLEWDMARGQLLAVPAERNNVVIAYDLADGQPITEYGIGDRVGPVEFLQLEDGRLFVYTHAPRGRNPQNGLALWNRDSNNGQNIQFAMDYYVPPSYDYDGFVDMPKFSPDGRYLMMRSTHYLYLWDLNGLNRATPHLPNYTHKVNYTHDAHFINNTTIETFRISQTDYQRVRERYTRTSYLWDVVTGAMLSQTPEERRWG